MSLDELRKRLEQLNRSPLPESDARTFDGRGEDARSRVEPPDMRLETLCPGRCAEIDGASYYAVERDVVACWPPGGPIHDRFTRACEDFDAGRLCADLHPELLEVMERGRDRLLFMDLETCGFAGTPVFLIGVMYAVAGDFRIEQLLARSYDEERAILGRFSRLLDQRPHLVTFNGKSFDWPFVSDRAMVARVSLRDVLGHCDLLHNARRKYKDVLPDCRLQTLEQYICGRRRSGDIPGRDIPSAYHDFVRSGDAREMRSILHHNFQDLVTLAEILADLTENG